MIRTTRGGLVSADDQNIIASVVLPRHTRGTVVYHKASMTFSDIDQTLLGWWGALLLIPQVPVEADLTTRVGQANFSELMESTKPIDVAVHGLVETGAPNNLFQDLDLHMERDFENISSIRKRALGLALESSGPAANAQVGWSLIQTSFDETLSYGWMWLMEVLVEWPTNFPQFFKREHVANEENQDS